MNPSISSWLRFWLQCWATGYVKRGIPEFSRCNIFQGYTNIAVFVYCSAAIFLILSSGSGIPIVTNTTSVPSSPPISRRKNHQPFSRTTWDTILPAIAHIVKATKNCRTSQSLLSELEPVHISSYLNGPNWLSPAVQQHSRSPRSVLPAAYYRTDAGLGLVLTRTSSVFHITLFLRLLV